MVELRKAELSDVESILIWENDPKHWLVSDTLAPFSRDQIVEFIKNGNDLYAMGQMRFMIMYNGDCRAGCIDLFDFNPKNERLGLGLLVDQEFQGKGIGSQAIELAVDYCFHVLSLHSIYAEVLMDNIASQKAFESNGFHLVGTKKDWLKNGNSYIDLKVFQKINKGESE